MKDKRGVGQEVDWILGVGLFLISVTFIFILFKPGITPVYDSQTLLDILQEGFTNNVTWEITKVPIFLAPSNEDYYGSTGVVFLDNTGIEPSAGEDYYDQLNDLVEEIGGEFPRESYAKIFYVESGSSVIPSTYTVTSEDDVNDFCTLPSVDTSDTIESFCEEDTSLAEEAISGEFVIEARTALQEYQDAATGQPNSQVERENQLEYGFADNSLVMPYTLGREVYKSNYLLLISNKPINFYVDEIDVVEEGAYQGCFAIGTLETPLSLALDDTETPEIECPVIYEFGASEKISGIDLPSFLSLKQMTIGGSDCNPGYECVKESWGFPESKEFKIEVSSIPNIAPGASFEFVFGERSIPENVNIFVRNFNSFILSDDGTKVPVAMKISTW